MMAEIADENLRRVCTDTRTFGELFDDAAEPVDFVLKHDIELRLPAGKCHDSVVRVACSISNYGEATARGPIGVETNSEPKRNFERTTFSVTAPRVFNRSRLLRADVTPSPL